MTRWRAILWSSLAPALAFVIALAAGALFILAVGRDPISVYTILFSETLGTWYGIGQVLFKATPLIFTGLSAAVGFRAGLFNVGADGQLAVGSLMTAAAGAALPASSPMFLIPACILAGMAGGALWGAIPGYLKARFGSHEVINTIMMNFVAAALISYVVNNFFSVPATVHTPPIRPGAELPRLDVVSGVFRGSPVNLSLLLAALACAAFAFMLKRTTLGYELRVIGANIHAATYAHIAVRSRIIVAMAIAGACSGLVGSNMVLGYKHYYEIGFGEGMGFLGIAVALVGQNHPAGIVVAALFFGLLEYGGLTINGMVPKELVTILQAFVILLVIVLTKVLRKSIRYAAG